MSSRAVLEERIESLSARMLEKADAGGLSGDEIRGRASGRVIFNALREMGLVRLEELPVSIAVKEMSEFDPDLRHDVEPEVLSRELAQAEARASREGTVVLRVEARTLYAMKGGRLGAGRFGELGTAGPFIGRDFEDGFDEQELMRVAVDDIGQQLRAKHLLDGDDIDVVCLLRQKLAGASASPRVRAVGEDSGFMP